MGFILIGGLVGFFLPTNQRAASLCIGLAAGGLLAGAVIILVPKASQCFSQSHGVGYLTFNAFKSCEKI